MKARIFALALLAIATTGCSGNWLGINLFIVGEKTALETQVLGTYAEIGRDLSSYASVRGVSTDGTLKVPPERTSSQADVLRAFDNRRYNRDDLDALLLSGAIGEGSDAMISTIDAAKATQANITQPLMEQIVREENENRETILARLMKTTPGVTAEQKPDVAWILARLNQDLAPVGSQVQSREGNWTAK